MPLSVALNAGLMDLVNFFSAEDHMDWDGEYPVTRYALINYEDEGLLVLRESGIYIAIAEDITDNNDTPIILYLSLALKQKSNSKMSNMDFDILNLRASRKASYEGAIEGFDLDQPQQRRGHWHLP